eukprot:scaffold4429_cov81-Skeletonema_dohrnii-CCMP3373.AAC.9
MVAFPLSIGMMIIIALLVTSLLLVLYAISKHRHNHYVDITHLQSIQFDSGSLFSFFQPHLISINEVSQRGYSSMLSLAQQMIGIQPIADSVMILWPPSFDCYNILLPNSLNFPEVILGVPGSVDIKLISLAMYASSRANGCAYCTSHCCTFAVRRGVDPSILRNLLTEVSNNKKSEEDDSTTGNLSPKESAVIKLAYGLGTVPCSLTAETYDEVTKLFHPSQLEWLVEAASLFGLLNKLTDGLNIPLETSTYQETIDIMDTNYTLGRAAAGMIEGESTETKATRQPPPPTDDWTNIISIMYHGLRPGSGAMWFERKMLRGIPTSAGECAVYLQKRCGCSFSSVLQWIQHDRFRRAIVYVIGKNFVSDNLPLKLKVQVGLGYCDILENAVIEGELKEDLAFVEKEEGTQCTDKSIELLILQVGKALSYAPTRVTPEIVKSLHSAENVTPAMLVELVSFLAVLQTLHRIISFQIIQKECHAHV